MKRLLNAFMLSLVLVMGFTLATETYVSAEGQAEIKQKKKLKKKKKKAAAAAAAATAAVPAATTEAKPA